MTEGQSALVLRVPEVEAVVSRWRRRYDPIAAFGVPAHITVLAPWLLVSDVAAQDRDALVSICGRTGPIDVTFTRFGTFSRTLWLDPQPAEPIRQLTVAIYARWPSHPPYGGVFDDSVPHLTIADQRDPAELGHVMATVESALPLRARIAELSLLVLRDDRWVLDATFPFGRTEPGHSASSGA